MGISRLCGGGWPFNRAEPVWVLVLACWLGFVGLSATWVYQGRQTCESLGEFTFHCREANRGFLPARGALALPPWLAPCCWWSPSDVASGPMADTYSHLLSIFSVLIVSISSRRSSELVGCGFLRSSAPPPLLVLEMFLGLMPLVL